MKIAVDVTPEQAFKICNQRAMAEMLADMTGPIDMALILLSDAIKGQFPQRIVVVCPICNREVEETKAGNAKKHGDCLGGLQPVRRGILFEEPKG
jgi:leucyl aminopeptidase